MAHKFVALLVLIFEVYTAFVLQTHTKNSKKSQPSHFSIAPDEKALNPLECPPYGTGHVVGAVKCQFMALIRLLIRN